VPRITVLQEIADGTLVSIPVQELDMKRKTFMVFRKSGYVSDAAQQFIDVISQFRWNESLVQPLEATVASRRALPAVRQRKLSTAS
jgi:hypothetical protein